MNKREIRKKILAVRDEIPVADRAQYDASIREIVMGMEEYRDAEAILAYVSCRSEVDTTMLIRQALADGKKVFAPKVSGNEMEFWQISSLEDLWEGYRGILEPEQSIAFPEWLIKRCSIVDTDTAVEKADDCVQDVCNVMMWMPGVAFDKERHRIGYGGGFYDRYLERLLHHSEQTVFEEHSRAMSGRFMLTTVALAYGCQVLERIPYEEHDVKPDFLITLWNRGYADNRAFSVKKDCEDMELHIELVIQKLTELSDWLSIGNLWGHKQRVDDAIKELSQPDLSELQRRQLKMLLSKKVLFHPKCLGDVVINDFGDGIAWYNYLSEIADICQENL